MHMFCGNVVLPITQFILASWALFIVKQLGHHRRFPSFQHVLFSYKMALIRNIKISLHNIPRGHVDLCSVEFYVLTCAIFCFITLIETVHCLYDSVLWNISLSLLLL